MNDQAMTLIRALEINSRIVGAWLFREGLGDGGLPDLTGFTLLEAITASETVAAAPPEPGPDGGRILTCHVATSRIPQLYAWAVSTNAMQRICQEHADGR